jgi:hypothetical protein
MKVTVFKNLKETTDPIIRDVEWAVERIRIGKSKERVELIRSKKTKAERNAEKQFLPSYLFAGEFAHRAKKGIQSFSGLVSLDFDGFKSYKEAVDFREQLKDVPYTYIAFISPSGDGVKAFFKVDENDLESYKQYFDSIEQFFSMPEFDKGVSDFSRVCYESFDPDIYFNPNCEQWTQKEVVELEELGCTNPSIAVTSENRIITNLLKWFNSKYSMSDGERNVNLFKLAAALNDFGISKSEALNVCLQFEMPDFKRGEIDQVLTSAYKATHKHGTKFFEDIHTRQAIEKKIRDGLDEKEIIESFEGFDRGEIKKVVSSIRQEITVDDFWYHTKNGGVQLSPHKYKYWLQSNGFFKFYPEGDGFTFVHKKENLLTITDETKIKDFVLDYLIKRHDIGYLPYDFMASSSKFFSSEFLKLLDTVQLDIKRDTTTECFLYYENGVVAITSKGTELVDYVDIDGFVWKDQIINRTFVKNTEGSVFEKFIQLIANKDPYRISSLMSVIGFLCHTYRLPKHNKAIIINDEEISENPNGRSGKGLFMQAIGKVRKMASIDGKNFSFDKSFHYQTVKVDTQVMVFDDVRKNFLFENLFSLITEGITLEYKGRDAIKLPPDKSPKVVITTNYTIGGTGGSHEGRKFEVEFSDYFNYKHTPIDEFGHMFYDEWDDAEWLRFDNFIVNCVIHFLNNGLVEYRHTNLETRKFIKETCYEFYEWTEEDNLPVNTRLKPSEYYEAFLLEYPESRKFVSQKRFGKFLQIYSQIKDLKFTKGKTNGERWIYFENGDAETETIEDIEEKSDMPF